MATALLLPFSSFAQKHDKDVTIKVEERVGDTVRTTIIDVAADSTRSKKHMTISVGSDGIEVKKSTRKGVYKDTTEAKSKSPLKIQWGMVDLGFNRIDDKTDYSLLNAGAPTPLDPSVPYSKEAFKLREGKSVNVNVWILNARLRLAETKRQRLYLTSGLGLQMYNFRFDNNVMYKSEPTTHLERIPSNLNVEKNKLGFTYAAVPLGLLAKTRIGDKWLVYGAGVTGGYRIDSWTKLKTSQNGKEKNHDSFNFADFNACVTGEIGLDDVFRLYGSYQLTNMNKSGTGLDQHPFAIGVRFIGL